MRSQHALQSGMQKMGGGMIGAGGAAPFAVHFEIHTVAYGKLAARHFDDMHMQRAQLFLGVDDLAFGFGREHQPGVAHLSAGFRIERRLVGEDFYRLT
jgi:hypothetical protein